jgi:membrane-bound metal-dependent hydrolase YbcI (DUF457 family)
VSGILAKKLAGTEASGRQGRVLLGCLVFLALLPDLDVLIYILFEPGNMQPHRGFSHSLLFCLIAAGVAMFPLARATGIGSRRLFFLSMVALVSHLLLDFLMGAGPPLPLFAPFSQAGYLSPVSFIPWAYYSTSAQGLLGILRFPPALLGFGLEFLIFVPLLLLLRHEQPTAKRVILATASAGALLATVVIYN